MFPQPMRSVTTRTTSPALPPLLLLLLPALLAPADEEPPRLDAVEEEPGGCEMAVLLPPLPTEEDAGADVEDPARLLDIPCDEDARDELPALEPTGPDDEPTTPEDELVPPPVEELLLPESGPVVQARVTLTATPTTAWEMRKEHALS